MKTFSFPPLFLAGALTVLISGCASTAANQADSSKASMPMHKYKMAKDGCACCAGMQHDGMSHGMKDKPMGMMQNQAGSSQAGMCMPAKDGKEKGGCGCCDMGKMGPDGCACCGMGKKNMTPEMHQKHMEMMKQHHPQMQNDKAMPQPMAK